MTDANQISIAQKFALREERKKLGALLVIELQDEFTRANELKQKLVPIVIAHPDGRESIYHKVAHPFVETFAMAEGSLEVGRIKEVLNSFEGCLFRIEGDEEQIEEELRPSGLMREITGKIRSFIELHPEVFNPTP